MAQESIDDYLKQIFSNRRYCSHCGAMTPILQDDFDDPNVTRVATSGMSIQLGPTCECCREPYQALPFQKLKIQETYGMAIFNEGTAVKVVREMK